MLRFSHDHLHNSLMLRSVSFFLFAKSNMCYLVGEQEQNGRRQYIAFWRTEKGRMAIVSAKMSKEYACKLYRSHSYWSLWWVRTVAVSINGEFHYIGMLADRFAFLQLPQPNPGHLAMPLRAHLILERELD